MKRASLCGCRLYMAMYRNDGRARFIVGDCVAGMDCARGRRSNMSGFKSSFGRREVK